MPGSRAIATRQKLIAQLVQKRMDETKQNSSLKLHNRESLAAAIGWSLSTIRDDIRDMQAEGQPIKFDTRRNGYVYTERFSGVPTTFITESDLAKVCLALRALESLKGSPLFKPIQKAIDKLTRALTEKFGIGVEALKSTVTFRSTGVDALTDPAVLETLMHAISNRQELEIAYSKQTSAEPGKDCPPNGGGEKRGNGAREANSDYPEESKSDASTHQLTEPAPPQASADAVSRDPGSTVPFPNAPWLQMPIESRKVHPLHILCQDNAWYLWLWDPVRKAKRRFALSRIRSLARTGKSFKARRFDLEKELADRIGITSGDPVDVRVQFRRKASYLVAERPWHRSQKLAPGANSEWNLELTMHVALTPELERWLMGYDQDFRVIEPAELKEAIDRKIDGMIAVRRSEC